jgi:hypothetical protein
MLQHAGAEVVGYSDVERSRAAGKDVDVELVVVLLHADSLDATREKQISPLRCGMTQSALRNEKQWGVLPRRLLRCGVVEVLTRMRRTNCVYPETKNAITIGILFFRFGL